MRREDGPPRPARALEARQTTLRWTRWLVLSALAVSGLLAAVLAGYLVARHQLFPYRYLVRAEGDIADRFHGAEPTVQRTLATHLLRLTVQTARVPVEGATLHAMAKDGTAVMGSTAQGGALASFGDDVILLAFDGRVYAARSAADIRVTAIQAPDNRRQAYAALAREPRYAGYSFKLHYIRYNDILVVDDGAARALVVSYTEFHPERACYTNTLARLPIAAGVTNIDQVRAAPQDWQVFFRTEPCLPLKSRFDAIEGHMAGGRLAFRPPATLLMTSGDYDHEGVRSDLSIAQRPNYQYGKVLELDLRSGAVRIVSTGNRNPQGIVVLPDDRVFAVEHGPQGGDELNLIRDGANFGWPLESYGVYYGGGPIPGALSYGRHDRFDPPIFSWSPAIGVSGLVRVEGFHPAWDGDLLASSLRGQSLHRLRLVGDRVVSDERIPLGSRLRDVHQHVDGRLVVWTDSNELIFITGAALDGVNAKVDAFADGAPPDVGARVRAVVARCAECHSFEPDDHYRAPSLAGIYGRPIGRARFAGYSDALAGHGGRWDDVALAEFLADPQRYAAGSSMPSLGLGQADIDAVIAFLRQQGQR